MKSIIGYLREGAKAGDVHAWSRMGIFYERNINGFVKDT